MAHRDGAALLVSVDNDKCQGHARCHALAPEFFTIDEEGYSNIGSDKAVPLGMEASVRSGVINCPEEALRATTP